MRKGAMRQSSAHRIRSHGGGQSMVEAERIR